MLFTYGFPSRVGKVRDDVCRCRQLPALCLSMLWPPSLCRRSRAVQLTTRWATSLLGTCTIWGCLFKEKDKKIFLANFYFQTTNINLKWENRTQQITNLKQVRNYSFLIGRHEGLLFIVWASKGAWVSAESRSLSFISFVINLTLMTIYGPFNPPSQKLNAPTFFRLPGRKIKFCELGVGNRFYT